MAKRTKFSAQFSGTGHRGRPLALVSAEASRRVVDAMNRYGLDQSELSSVLGSTDRPSSDRFQVRLKEMLEIVERIRAWTKTDEEALEWYSDFPVPAFGGQPPAELVRRGMASTVQDYIDHISHGGYA